MSPTLLAACNRSMTRTRRIGYRLKDGAVYPRDFYRPADGAVAYLLALYQ